MEAGGPKFLNPASLLFLAMTLGGDYNPVSLMPTQPPMHISYINERLD